jgi:sporadic carbohydrate cluster protein (TIGR04323 family)
MSERGYRGYIGSRPVRGTAFPQRVQNLVVRDYAARHGLPYRLSLVEYAMPNCYMMLRSLMAEVPRLDGVIFFSAFMLPETATARHEIYERIFATGATLHAALENRALKSTRDVAALEATLLVAQALRTAPFGGRYEKDGRPPAIGSATDAALLALV